MTSELNCGAEPEENRADGACVSHEPQRSDSLMSASNDPVDTGPSSISAVSTVTSKTTETSQSDDNFAPLALIPFFESKRSETGTSTIAPFWFESISFAASLILLILVSVGAVCDHFRQSTLLAASAHETESLASADSVLKSRLDAIEGPGGRGNAIDLRKALDQIKAEFSNTREVNANFAQLKMRLDRIDNDHNVRLGKLTEQFDREMTSRFPDMLARLDKLEKKAAPLPGNASAPTSNRPPILQARGDLSNPNETTGSIEKPLQFVRGFSVAGVGDGYAVINSRNGPQPVRPGDFIPGVGRVLRIERHGREWAVVTSLGVISSDPNPY